MLVWSHSLPHLRGDAPNDELSLSALPACHASRPGATRKFCSQCGTQLTFSDDTEPEVLDVTACSLDEVEGIAPEDHIWCDRMVLWLKFADGLPRYGLRKFH